MRTCYSYPLRLFPCDPAPVGNVARVVAYRADPILGFEFDLRAFPRWARRTDPLLGRLAVSLRGFRPPLARNPFEMLVGSITAQQVSLRAALAIRNRFVQRFGVRGVHAYAFPERARVARAKPAQLVALGLSGRKAEYVVGLARSDLDLDALASLPDEDVKTQITSVRGLGEWTADWFLARHLGRPHAWPAGDLGLRKAVSALYRGGRDMTIDEVRAIGSRFAPFENLSAQYLLTGLRVAPESARL